LAATAGPLALVAVMTMVSGVLTAQQPPAGAPAGAAPPTPAGGRGQGTPDACGGRSSTPEVACPSDVTKMLAVLPEKAPATPVKPRKVLVLGRAAGFAHSSRPLAAKTIEEMGKKTGAWTTDITYDAAAITADNLKQYDLVFLDSTTGLFLDDPNDQAATDARRKALLDFVRGGKGLAGIHAATDSYHGGGRGRAGGGAGAPGTPAAPGATTTGAAPAAPATAAAAPAAGGATGAPPAGGGGRGTGGGPPLWPEFNKMIGGYFKFHWVWPTPITVKIDDPASPINATFKGQSFNINDEVYTFNQDSWSRDNVHVLTSIDYSMMSESDKKKESSPRTDHDFGLSWIRREGQGRVFYEALGHHESIYYDNPQILEHILAGMQYALGDLKADDTPSTKMSGTGSRKQ
jgi:type 1 glutamine amidotransferase